jgi:hypothetical protein
MAFVVTVFAFLALCGMILGVLAVIRAWRVSAAEEELQYRTSDRLVALDGYLSSSRESDEPDADSLPAAWSPPNANGSNGAMPADVDVSSRRSRRRGGRAAG